MNPQKLETLREIGLREILQNLMERITEQVAVQKENEDMKLVVKSGEAALLLRTLAQELAVLDDLVERSETVVLTEEEPPKLRFKYTS